MSLSAYLIVANLLFALGMAGMVVHRKNMVSLLMSIELILLAVNINWVAFSHYGHQIAGQVFAFFILAVAAAETAIGLALLVVFFKKRQTVSLSAMNRLKG